MLSVRNYQLRFTRKNIVIFTILFAVCCYLRFFHKKSSLNVEYNFEIKEQAEGELFLIYKIGF
jgi:hypothetical protein